MSDPTTPPAQLELEAHAPDRNLALALVRVTGAAAMAAGQLVGRGDKDGADGGAVTGLPPLLGPGRETP